MSGSDEPVETYRGGVAAWECDVFGHLNIAFYVERFADAALDLLERKAPERRWRTVALDTSYQRELRAGDGIVISSVVLATASGAVRIAHAAVESATGAPATRAEHLLAPLPPGAVALAPSPPAWDAFPAFAWPRGMGLIAAGRDRIRATETADGRLAPLGYLHRFSNACLHVIEAIGMDPAYRSRANHGFATFETRLLIDDPSAAAGEGVVVTSGVVAVGRSSLGMLHRAAATRDGRPLARFYQAGVHFDLAARRASPWPEAIRTKAQALRIADS